MKSLVGVSIQSKGEVFGNLYLADKLDPGFGPENEHLINFDENDARILEQFATQAAIAIENAQLYRMTSELAVLQERERFSMDLHDGIMQSVYATGLHLQEASRSVDSDPDEARERIRQANLDLSEVQRDIRNYILGLRPDHHPGQDLVAGIELVVRELRANTLLNLSFDQRTQDPAPGQDHRRLPVRLQAALRFRGRQRDDRAASHRIRQRPLHHRPEPAHDGDQFGDRD